MQTTSKRRLFYTITAVAFVAILGTAVFIVVYLDDSYVKIEVTGASNTSLVLSYDSTKLTLSPSENATVEVLPHANVTITANPTAPYTVAHWDVGGATAIEKGQDSVNFLTGQGGSAIRVSIVLAANSSS
jgi:beta-lactamase superfamily II metal-dependent hydrolase